jgi:glycosyltransferase involved in cell wall biosynthesis
MYSEKPILHAFSGGGDVVKIANCGVSVKAGDKNAIAYGVKKLYAMSKEERADLGTNGKQYVIKHFSYKELALKLESLF